MAQRVKTPEQVKKEFDRRGKSVRGWAAENDLPEKVVYDVLSGRLKGRRGVAHEVATRLGLKDGVVGEAA